MLYLISQVLLLLALASIVSGLIGWLLRAFQSDKAEKTLKQSLRSSQRAVPSMQRALAAAHYEIDRRENDIHRLRRKIAEIDSDPARFRAGDLEGGNPEELANELVGERAVSGNSKFRDSDFEGALPTNEEEKRRAIEFLNTRSEDTEGRYRVEDFAKGYPSTDAENIAADLLDAQRSAPEKFFREGDFVHGAPRNTAEQHFANHLVKMREDNKAEREDAKEHRRLLVLELNKASDELHDAQQLAAELQAQVNESGATQVEVEAFEHALENAHGVIKQQEQQINELTSEIGAIDNDPQNFREGDLENNDPRDFHEQRATSGNSSFRVTDFANSAPFTEEEKRLAIEYLNNRDEDTDGKYRDGDFANGTPMTPAEKELSNAIDSMREDLEKHYRETDFNGEKPKTEEEIKLAAHIEVMRAKNKSKRKANKQRRQELAKQLEASESKLSDAQAEIARLQGEFNSRPAPEVVSNLESELTNAKQAIEAGEQRIDELETKIEEIDNNPKNFREGDLENNDPRDFHEQRATSGNSSFRVTDFANSAPFTEEEKRLAIEYLNNRDEDTDGKYRDGDFANGTPMTPAEKELSNAIDAMREDLEKHYRETDFNGEKPQTEEEIKLAAHIEVMRAKNKATRKANKQRRQELARQLETAEGNLTEAKAEIDRLQRAHDARPEPETVKDLERALTDAKDVIDVREKRIDELENKIQEIDTDPNHFRAGDLENLNGLTPLERAMELAIARATSGNSNFRNSDFDGKIPLSDDAKKLAIEYLASRDEDTDGKYRQSDFANGIPQNEAEFKRAASLDGMRTVLQKLYREEDFEGDQPNSEAELELAARIDTMRAKNKAYRSASKKQRKILKQDLANAREEQQRARAAVVEIESRMQGIATNNEKLEDIIASLKVEISDKTALQNQAGKHADDLAREIDKLERELAKTTHDGHKKAADLERELRTANDNLNLAKQELSATTQSLQSAQDTLSERTIDKQKLQEQYAHQKTELALATSQLSERKQELVKLNAEKNRQIQELEYALQTQKADNARMEKELEQLRSQLQAAQNNSADRAAQEAAEARVKELETSLKDYASQSQTWEELKLELQNKDNELYDLQSNLEEYQEMDDALRNRIDVLESMLAEQRLLAGQSMSSRIREIEAMLSAERRKVESLTLQASVAEVSSAPVSRVVKTSSVSKFSSSKKNN